MKRFVLLIFCLQCGLMTINCFAIEDSNGSIYQWRSHMAYTTIDEIALLGDKVFALSTNALFSVNKTTEEIEYYNRLSGLSGVQINHISYNEAVNKLLITYEDGRIDFIDQHGNIYNISDLFVKQMSVSKKVNDIYMHEELAYMAMSFGILVVNMEKMEIEDTYYIGQNSTEVYVEAITINENMIYAVSQSDLYIADLSNNLADYNFWQKHLLPVTAKVQSMCSHKGKVFLVQNKQLYQLADDKWKLFDTDFSIRKIRATNNHLYIVPENTYGALELKDDFSMPKTINYGYIIDIKEDNGILWLGTGFEGLVKYKDDVAYANYLPEGPISNNSYRLRIFGDKLYVLPGGRWASQYSRPGEIMIFDNNRWTNINNETLVNQAEHKVYDIMNVAQDPNDSDHYFITTYGTGMLEMQGTDVVKLHLASNSGLYSAVPKNPDLFTRTDGIMFDNQNNLWILNAGELDGNIHVVSPTGKWTSFNLNNNGEVVRLYTPGDFIMDQRNTEWKWISIARAGTGLILLQDNGTPHNPNDDKVTYRTTWMDQNENQIAPVSIYSITQDKKNIIWVGTSSGLFIIPPIVDFTTSNKCERIIMPRNDGTQLGDYLLDNEQINAIAIDGANRIWIGTASSGLYLMDYTEDTDDAAYTLETIAHFTTDNSLLPSNNILSLAIHKSTGEVFVGTGSGLVSYVSDATEPEADFSSLYAYPNPVHPNYQGYVTIVGAMENTEVRIVDASGNLVRKIKSTGGSAAWDCTNTQGTRVASGVYTALCNTTDGNGHGVVKILIMN